MTYRVRVPAEVQDALGRLQEGDPVGAEWVVSTIAALAADPRPAGVHVLNLAMGLHRIRGARLDPATGRNLQYRIMYQIDDEDLVVAIVTAGALPAPAGAADPRGSTLAPGGGGRPGMGAGRRRRGAVGAAGAGRAGR